MTTLTGTSGFATMLGMSEERARFEVLLKQIKDQFELVAEGHASLNETIGHMSRKQDELAAKVDKIVIDGAGLRLDMNFVKNDVSVLRSKVVKLEEDVHLVKTDVHMIKDHLGLNGVAKRTKPKPTPKRRPPKK